MGFHIVNVLLHAVISVLVGLLCGHMVGTLAADATGQRRIVASLVGGGLFAVHPVHVEAVSNVAGQAELWSAFGVLGATLLHIETRGGDRRDRLFQHLSRILLLGGVGTFLLVARSSVLGALTGEDGTAVLAGLDVRERLAHVLPLLRLLVWPVTLAADYDPGVIFSASGPTLLETLLGGVVLLSWIGSVVWFWARSRAGAVGLAWFILGVLPVSNPLFATGSLMAERTLYLPSVGSSVLTAGVFGSATTAPVRTRRLLHGLAFVVLIVLRRAASCGPQHGRRASP
jgi:hypothetical protein